MPESNLNIARKMEKIRYVIRFEALQCRQEASGYIYTLTAAHLSKVSWHHAGVHTYVYNIKVLWILNMYINVTTSLICARA